MAQANNTRDQILNRAGQLLMSRGFNGFSYRDISSHLGVKNAAVHYHFPAKADLAIALIDEYRQTLRSRTSEFLAYGGPAIEQLEGLFAFTAHQCKMGRCICPFGAFSVDFADLSAKIRTDTADFMEETVSWLTRVLEVGKNQHEFKFNGEARQKALSILAGLQGARQMARIHGIELLDAVIQQVRDDLELSR